MVSIETPTYSTRFGRERRRQKRPASDRTPAPALIVGSYRDADTNGSTDGSTALDLGFLSPDGGNDEITSTRGRQQDRSVSFERLVRGNFDRKPSARFFIHPSEGFFARPMAVSLWSRIVTGISSHLSWGFSVRPSWVVSGNTFRSYALRTPWETPRGPVYCHRLPCLQAVQNVTALKSFNVAVKYGVSNVSPTVSVLVQRSYPCPSGTSNEIERYRHTTVSSNRHEGCL